VVAVRRTSTNWPTAGATRSNEASAGAKHWRGVATRFDKLGEHYQATLDLVEALDWLRAKPDRSTS
jgi:hypothetical protein